MLAAPPPAAGGQLPLLPRRPERGGTQAPGTVVPDQRRRRPDGHLGLRDGGGQAQHSHRGAPGAAGIGRGIPAGDRPRRARRQAVAGDSARLSAARGTRIPRLGTGTAAGGRAAATGAARLRRGRLHLPARPVAALLPPGRGGVQRLRRVRPPGGAAAAGRAAPAAGAAAGVTALHPAPVAPHPAWRPIAGDRTRRIAAGAGFRAAGRLASRRRAGGVRRPDSGGAGAGAGARAVARSPGSAQTAAPRGRWN